MGMGDLVNLQSLRLWGTKLSGERPLRLSCHNSRHGDRTQRFHFSLLYDHFPFIPGTIPEGVGKLGALIILRLDGTKVSGKTLLLVHMNWLNVLFGSNFQAP